MQKHYLELHLPAYVQQDIDGLIEAYQTGKLVDCLRDEVYGSINSAWVEQRITTEQANFLRNKYLSTWGILEDATSEPLMQTII